MTKISQELSRAESWILGELSKLDALLQNLQLQVKSGIVPRFSWDTDWEIQEGNEDRFQNDPQPEVRATVNRFPHTVISDPDAVVYNCQCSYKACSSLFYTVLEKFPTLFKKKKVNNDHKKKQFRRFCFALYL